MDDQPFDPERHLEVAAAAVGLAIAPDWRAGVLANLATAARMAAIVREGGIDDHVEPAFVFEAGQ